MIIISLLSMLAATPLFSTKISSVQLTRMTSIIFIFAFFISFNIYYVFEIDNGMSLFSGLFHVSIITIGMELVFFILGSFIALHSAAILFKQKFININNIQPIVPEYGMILIFTIIGGSLLISSIDLISLFLSIELQSFSVYILATIYRNNESATSGGLKYFLLGALSSALILLGSSLIYAHTGLTNLDQINSLINVLSISNLNNGIILGLIIMTFGFLFKISSAPFHNWAPDVYDGVPTLITIWLAVIPKISILIFMFTIHTLTQELYFDLGEISVNIWQTLLLFCSFLSLIIGTVGGLAQSRIKRLLSYSTISHIGFILLALSIVSQESLEAFLFYIIQYSITNVNTFLIVLAFGYLIKSSISNSNSESVSYYLQDIQFISRLAGQFKFNPILSLSMIICLFSMAGIPPLMGFFAKYAVLYSAIHNGYYFISLTGIITSVISAFYYLRIVRVLYFENIVSSTHPGREVELLEWKEEHNTLIISNVHSYLIALLTVLIIGFIFEPSIILNSTQIMSMSIYSNSG